MTIRLIILSNHILIKDKSFICKLKFYICLAIFHNKTDEYYLVKYFSSFT